MISTAELVSLIVGACVATVALQWFFEQYVLPPPGGSIAHAKHYRVVRHHRESLKSWETRTVAAAKAFRAAEDAFVTEAERLGRLERVSRAGLRWSLPSNHSLSLALLSARYPDGPSAKEWERIASGEVVVTGVDVSRC